MTHLGNTVAFNNNFFMASYKGLDNEKGYRPWKFYRMCGFWWISLEIRLLRICRRILEIYKLDLFN